MANNRLYPFWNDLEEGLKTGNPQNETKNEGAPIFELLYADKLKLKEFLDAMGESKWETSSSFQKYLIFQITNHFAMLEELEEPCRCK